MDAMAERSNKNISNCQKPKKHRYESNLSERMRIQFWAMNCTPYFLGIDQKMPKNPTRSNGKGQTPIKTFDNQHRMGSIFGWKKKDTTSTGRKTPQNAPENRRIIPVYFRKFRRLQLTINLQGRNMLSFREGKF